MSNAPYLAQKNEITLFEHAARHRLPVLLKGPTGCGKTRFVYHMAEQLKLPVYTVACHDDLSAADLVGRHLIGSEGTYWQDGPLTRAVREGGICYLDEIVEARKDTTVVLHPLTDHRRVLPIDRTGELLEAHADFMLVVSYNPGYQNVMKGLKPSTRQRFVAMTFDYPQAEKEQQIVVQETNIEPAIATQLVALAQAMRRLTDFELEEAASTRLLIYAGLLIGSGLPIRDACIHAMLEPLTDDSETQNALLKLIDLHFE